MRTLLIGILLLLSLRSFKCTKGQSTVSGGSLYTGVVVHNICCQTVIQMVNADTVGQDTWIDSNKTPAVTYRHVFKVANPCQFGTHREGDTILFRIAAQQAQNCACCMLYVRTPAVAYPINVVN